jgi:hypothetical protein
VVAGGSRELHHVGLDGREREPRIASIETILECHERDGESEEREHDRQAPRHTPEGRAETIAGCSVRARTAGAA